LRGRKVIIKARRVLLIGSKMGIYVHILRVEKNERRTKSSGNKSKSKSKSHHMFDVNLGLGLGEEAKVVTSESLPLASLLFWTQKLYNINIHLQFIHPGKRWEIMIGLMTRLGGKYGQDDGDDDDSKGPQLHATL
jgi:hypothetical protein